MGGIVLDCAEMPSHARDDRRVAGPPVFDLVTMLGHADTARIDPRRWDADAFIQPVSTGR